MSSGLSTWTLITALHKLAYDMEQCHTNRLMFGLWTESHPYYQRRKRQHDRILTELERRFKGENNGTKVCLQ